MKLLSQHSVACLHDIERKIKTNNHETFSNTLAALIRYWNKCYGECLNAQVLINGSGNDGSFIDVTNDYNEHAAEVHYVRIACEKMKFSMDAECSSYEVAYEEFKYVLKEYDKRLGKALKLEKDGPSISQLFCPND